MTSPYSYREFNEKLKSITEKDEGIKISFVPPIFEIFQDNKYFAGKITGNTFKLQRNSMLFTNSYYVTGNYFEKDNRTVVSVELTRNKFHYYVLRFGPLLLMLISDILLAGKIPVTGLLGINAFFCLGFIGIPIDNFRGRTMMERFIEEMRIDYPNNRTDSHMLDVARFKESTSRYQK